jgi:hypothetical protein
MRHSLLFMVFLFTGIVSYGQDSLGMKKGFYIGINAGYGLGIGQQYDYLNYDGSSVLDSAEFPSDDIVMTRKRTSSFGRGTNVGLTAGYNGGNWEVGLSASYFMGEHMTFRWKHTSNIYYDYSSERDYSATMIKLEPYFGIAIHPSWKVKLFTSAGPVIGVAGMINYREVMDREEPYQDYNYEWEYSGGLAWGFNYRLGCAYKLSDRIALSGAFDFSLLSFGPRYGKMVVYEYDGVNQLGALQKKDKEVVFEDEVSYKVGWGSPPDSEGRSVELRKIYNLSSSGLRLGINYSF